MNIALYSHKQTEKYNLFIKKNHAFLVYLHFPVTEMGKFLRIEHSRGSVSLAFITALTGRNQLEPV